jgi:hypothetical protein
MVGQVRHRLVVERDHLPDIERYFGGRLGGTELLVGQVHVAEIDAAERLDLAGHGLRIFHRGFDQGVEIERLDVEGATHVGAAVLEQPDHQGPVLDRIEAGPHVVGLGRHLAQRQRGGEHLDQDRIHRSIGASGGTCFAARVDDY